MQSQPSRKHFDWQPKFWMICFLDSFSCGQLALPSSSHSNQKPAYPPPGLSQSSLLTFPLRPDTGTGPLMAPLTVTSCLHCHLLSEGMVWSGDILASQLLFHHHPRGVDLPADHHMRFLSALGSSWRKGGMSNRTVSIPLCTWSWTGSRMI